MKHLLNDMTEDEKNKIREQHKGGMTLTNENFSKLLNSKSGDVKPFLNENMLDNISKKLEMFANDPLLQKIVRAIIKVNLYAPTKVIDILRALWNATLGLDQWGVEPSEKEKKYVRKLLNPFVNVTESELEDLFNRREEIGKKLKSLLPN